MDNIKYVSERCLLIVKNMYLFDFRLNFEKVFAEFNTKSNWNGKPYTEYCVGNDVFPCCGIASWSTVRTRPVPAIEDRKKETILSRHQYKTSSLSWQW